MIVGTVRERKVEEHRVGLTPEGARALVSEGHRVLVETGAGADAGFPDEAYASGGAEIAPTAEAVWSTADLVVKVKEPQPDEFRWLRPGLTLFAYLHLAASPDVARALLDAGVTAIAYETVRLPDGTLPLLIPMSQIAGRMATEIGAQYLRKPGPGRGKLLSGLPGAPPAHVVILGTGTVATNAAMVAVALGARVTVLGIDAVRLRQLADRWPGRVATLMSNAASLRATLDGADVLITAAHVFGGRAPQVVTRDMVRSMGPGAVAVVVDIDQGGSVEGARPTTHRDPIYVEDGVVHYCVANMPGAVPYTATSALTAATLPYVLALARGVDDALRRDPALRAGLSTYRGALTQRPVADALGMPFVEPDLGR
ncbi:MAG TPA: alanine dehydrogenase [Dehalococcoidia bacterium]|nr:alanine dehydrogenase [Dehalococcoidia bacterium]